MGDDKPTPPPEPPQPETTSPMTPQTHGHDRPPDTKIMIDTQTGEIRRG